MKMGESPENQRHFKFSSWNKMTEKDTEETKCGCCAVARVKYQQDAGKVHLIAKYQFQGLEM